MLQAETGLESSLVAEVKIPHGYPSAILQWAKVENAKKREQIGSSLFSTHSYKTI